MSGQINLNVFIPVVWAIVAALLALALYRTSRGLFTGHWSDAGSRRLRLTGSIVIAAVIFFGLKWATPSELLSTRDLEADAAKQQEKATAALRALDDVKACAQISATSQCEDEISILEDRVRQLAD